MKYLLLMVGIVLTSGFAFAQTNQLNLQKYWKLRDALREDFVRISPDPGGSLVARGLKPNTCFNNVDLPNPGDYNLGEMHFGDGMIRQGYYLSLLATEYRLLKDAGQDVTGVLNELYYALEAINRNDFQAEFEQAIVYGFSSEKILNGFYMREDIPENFAQANWGNTDMRMYCVNSPHFETNNAAKLNVGDLVTKPNSYQNVPSMDQLSSLMVGFSMIHKLVDDTVLVKPTPASEGRYMVTETRGIVNRIMTYLNERNWMMIDVNGWPVNNGGGDCMWAAYPLYLTALRITGNHYNTDWTRRAASFYLEDVQYCITGYGLESNSQAGRDDACMHAGDAIPPGQAQAYVALGAGGDFGENNNQDESVFQEWLASGPLHGEPDVFSGFWMDPNDYAEDPDYDLYVPGTAIGIINMLSDNSGEDDHNFGILSSNLATAAKLWPAEAMHSITSMTGNYQLDLANAILRDETPAAMQTFYKNFLDQMTITGPYNIVRKPSENINTHKGATGGWASEDRWTWAADADGGINCNGIFNGIDYMLFHNLYRLVYPDNQPLFSPEAHEEYFNEPIPQVTNGYPLSDPNYNTINYNVGIVNNSLTFIPASTENVFKKVNNIVNDNFNITTYFPEYTDMNIFTNKFQTENTSFEPGSFVTVNTPFILCNNSTLDIKANAVMKIVKKQVKVNSGSTIDLRGELYVHGGTDLIVKSGASLNLHPGSSLILHEDCNVIIEPGATLTYYAGAKIYTKNETGYLVIKGNLNLEDNATFTIDHSYAAISGCVVFEGSPQINAKPGAKVLLNSKGKDDPILAVKANTTLKFSDPDLVNVRLENCGIDLSETHASIRFEQPVFTKEARFAGAENEAGKIIVTDINHFSKTDFHDMYVAGLLNIENKATLNIQFCNFTQEDGSAHNGAGIFVTGRNYNIRGSNFALNASGNAVIESEALTLGSIITGCTFNSTNATFGDKAVYDFSNTQIKISKSEFNHLRECVHKSMGTLLLKCNRFVDTYQTSVIADKYCFLNMSVNQGAGYNTFTPMTGSGADRSHILLSGGEIYMDMGLNYFSDVPVAGGLVRGKVSSNCSSTSNCLMDFGGNQWAANPNTPPVNSSRFYIRSLNNIPVTVTTESPIAQLACGTYGGPYTVLDPETASDPVKMGVISKYYSAILEDFVRIDQGIDQAIALLSSVSDDSTGNDLKAIALFDEIFSSSIDYFSCTASSQRMLEIAQSNMKIALESLFDQGTIDKSDNVSEFEYSVGAYVNALNKLTLDEGIKGSYGFSFRVEMNKAHLLRLIGHSDKAIDVLTHLEDCGVDFDEQVLVNFEKTNAYKDHYVSEMGAISIDTPFVMDNKLLVSPVSNTGPYYFGTVLQSLNNFLYSGCNDPKSLNMAGSNELMVFPNPARDMVQFQIQSESMEGKSSLKIIQIDGRSMYQNIGLNVSMNGTISVNTSTWASGAYHYSFTSYSGKTISGVFIVE